MKIFFLLFLALSILWYISKYQRELIKKIKLNAVIKYPSLIIIVYIISMIRKIKFRPKHQKVLQELAQSAESSQITNSKTTSLTEIDLCIITFNSEKWINTFLESILQQDFPTEKINIFLADHSSTDNTVAIINNFSSCNKENFKSVNIFQRENVGFGCGHDFLIRQGTSKYCLITNVDLQFDKESIVRIVNYAENDNEKVASWEFRQKPYEHPKYYDPITFKTAWSAHAAVLMRRDAYLEVGGYEKRIFLYGEDVELSYRFRAYDYDIKYCPFAVVWHFTYEKQKVKPLQYSGSKLANAYIRLRYGNFLEKLHIIPLYLISFLLPSPFPGSKKMLCKNILLVLKNFSYFANTKKKTTSRNFTFSGFDYSINREGAIYRTTEKNETILVSIITRTIPIRSFSVLAKAMMCVANQTYKNIELIIVEDGGGCHQKSVSEFSEKMNLNCRYISLSKVGRAAAGNIGMQEANGNYLLFFDDDDFLFADHVETLVNGILQEPGKFAAAYSLSWELLIKNNTSLFKLSVPHLIKKYNQSYSYQNLQKDNYIPIQSILFSKQLFIERGGFNENLDYLEDWNLWIKYGQNNKFLFIPKTTSIYLINIEFSKYKERNLGFFKSRKTAQKTV